MTPPPPLHALFVTCDCSNKPAPSSIELLTPDNMLLAAAATCPLTAAAAAAADAADAADVAACRKQRGLVTHGSWPLLYLHDCFAW